MSQCPGQLKPLGCHRTGLRAGVREQAAPVPGLPMDAVPGRVTHLRGVAPSPRALLVLPDLPASSHRPGSAEVTACLLLSEQESNTLVIC